MTDEQISLADLLLSKFTLNEPTQTYNLWKNFINTEDHNIDEFSAIRKFLLNQGYIYCTDTNFPMDTLTKKGELVNSKYGHKKYLIYEIKHKNLDNIKEFILYVFVPIITLLTLLFTIFPLTCNSRRSINNKYTTTQVDTSSKNNHP